ncbi:SDR family NAD(P)-dependent oxidoreductase [Alicyclobacillus shizuokensis]|uniref:SDR family NAD(P)-dependent oxidoreductase n=1 Tax=Alicyclobacillus shizuokensis TaxID=392014 RepID=UPI0008354C41|nr:glucose 1-dehydrogenase [Alicyclobacillus shizuokensis]
MGRLSDKVAIITGAASGMGAVTAQLFAREGAKVIATDIQDDKLKEVVNDINKQYGEVSIAIRHDVTDEKSWEDTVKQGAEHFGKINVLINNAGIGASDADFEDYPLDDWNKVLSVDATGNLLGIKHVVPEMKKAGGGSIVNISSLAALLALPGAGIAYSAAKGATRTLTKVAANNLARFNIRVNSIHPGYILTDLVRKHVPEEVRKQLADAHIPLGKFGDPEDIAYISVFLASDESKFMTGSEVVADGGQAIR